ncbi:sensor histidine kinase [Streptomyces sp. 6N223]|uniref:sensor histidine kinase n=1 Tax=Streptomyces sp. 6N223 TaxID=3457412 RepID=UPI003FD1144C
MPRLPRPHRHDVWIAAAGLTGGLVGIAFDLHVFTYADSSPLMLVGLLAMCGAELLRRTAQPWVLLPGLAALLADSLTGGLLAVVVMYTDLVYAAVLYGSARSSQVVLRASTWVTVVATLLAIAVWRQPAALMIGAALAAGLASPAWTAMMIRDHREAAAAERLRAEQTALLAERDRVQAVNAERARMARELHDLVAGHLSAIAIHSTAALSLDEPGAARTALGVIRENSTQGLAEMRRLIGLLRDSGAEGGQEKVEATPSLDGVEALLVRAERSGASGQLRFTRRDHRDGRSRPPAPVELAAYRIVQESLTNAVKHAAPGEVAVDLRQDKRSLVVTVTSPYDHRAAARAPGSGAGLVGMRERVELLRGSFAAGVADGPDGAPVWRVRAELPVAGVSRT